jgi:hypothetical protein
LAIGHGLAHVIYPFLNKEIGVNRLVDVWQDQIFHLGQAILFSSIFFDSSKSFRTISIIFCLSNILNVIAGYYCWGKECHDFYVWLSLAPALASGLHFATGTLFQNSRTVAIYGFLLQGTSSVLTYFMFKASDDILKFFALCRFFEIYFIASHYVGFFYSRYVIYKQTSDSKHNILSAFLQVIGIYPSEISNNTIGLLQNYFDRTIKVD